MTIELKSTEIKDTDDIATALIKKLNGLGVTGVSIKEAIVGPIVTAYPLEIKAYTSVKDLINKSDDLAVALNVESVDIRRVGGQVIAFVANKERQLIKFDEMLWWYLNDEEVSKMRLPIMLGVDYQGNKSVLELTEQPHILIAGSTGSGKSITEASFISALSVLRSPSELEFYLVDTKGLDLNLFEGLSHVKGIIREIEDWDYTLDTLLSEVERRNRLLATNKCRNINEYNNKIANSHISEEYPPKANGKLPYIILVIDELADLIMRDKERRYGQKNFPILSVAMYLQRLVQICRASGIHIIACTQRTSVDVTGGVIKANFPTRIALKLPSAFDSKTILDRKGAENLLGKGDMLVKTVDSDLLKRYHSPFVELKDIEVIINQHEQLRNSIRSK